MKTLEETLGRVENLRRDLSAEIVLQEEKSHDEKWVRYTSKVEISREDVRNLYNTGSGDIVIYNQEMVWVGPLEKEPAKRPKGLREEFNRKIIDQPGIKKQDTKKRADARAELLHVYEVCEWYSVRYLAGICLGSPEKFNNDIESWTEELEKGILSVSEKIRGYQELEKMKKETLVPDYRYVPDEAKRISSAQDLARLFQFSRNEKAKQLLIDSYKSNEVSEVRVEAGRALGYSRFRIWFHETFSSCPRTLEVPALSSPYPENPDKNEDDNLDPTSFMRGR